MSSTPKKKAPVVRCKSCGYRKRGPNHDEGFHHKQGRAIQQPKEKENKK